MSSTRVTPFDFNSQQGVAEILQVVLDELKGVQLAASSLSVCLCLCLCLSLFLSLSLSLSESTRETCVMNSAPILAIQFCRFSNQGGQLVKGETLVSCTQSQVGQYFTVPITIEDEVSFINKYSLIATINHSVTLSGRHYWACIKELHSPCWYLYLCNDKLVYNVEESCLNNTTSYILFYCKV